MRRDLDTLRERVVAREVRRELRSSASDWAFADLRARIGRARSLERIATLKVQARLEHLRPGTSDGGF